MSAPTDPGFTRHPPGWYLVEGCLAGASQASTRYRLQVAAAGRTQTTIPLAQGHGGRCVVPVRLLAPFDTAWVETDSGDVAVGAEDCRLRPIPMWRALLHLLAAARPDGRRRGLAGMLGLLGELATTTFAEGPRAAVDVAVARQLHELWPGPQVPVRFARRWWHAGRGALQPGQHLQPDAAGGWRVDGDDPQFRLVRYGRPIHLPAGWYCLRVMVVARSGAIVAPALYPDYGNGYQHEEMIPLSEPDVRGRIDALVLLKWDVHVLRFDPTIRYASFVVRECKLLRVTRPSALLRMLLGSHERMTSWRTRSRTAVTFAANAVRHGLSTATRDLYALQSTDSGGSYSEWVRRYDACGRAERENLAQRVVAVDGPTISVLVPTYNTPARWLQRCLDSVLRQAYPFWELCIADDTSTAPHVRRLLEEYARRDPRVRVVFRSQNGHISEASNSALELATGNFIGLLDHDDELRSLALLEMAEAIAAHPQADLLYSDEDKIDAEGRRFQPNFKPDWNYDLLLSQNYVCHFTVIRTELVRAVGGFRKGFEGSQDHDLFLRCIERLSPERIHHVPKVLYHWRAIEGSTALTRGAKDYAADAGRKAVSEHLQRIGAKANVDLLPHGHYRVRWQLPEPAPRVSLVVPTRDQASLLRACVESVLRGTEYPDFEVLVVDNQSTEPEAVAYLEELAHRPQVRVLRYPHPFNYSAINNWAATQATGSVLCLLNNDIEVIAPNWLREMVAHASRPDIGAVGAMLYYPDRTIQHAGVILGIGGIANHAFQHQPAGSPGYCARALVAQNLSAVTGACLVVRRAVFEEVGGLDERLAVAFNDIDFCLRIREAGYRNLWTPFAELVHHESVSRGADDTPEKRARFQSEVALMQVRWGHLLLYDPAYNPNLTLEATDFGCAFPPRQ